MEKDCCRTRCINHYRLQNILCENNFLTYFTRYTLINKKFVFGIICLFMSGCNIVAQNTDYSISMTDVKIPGVIIIGSYNQLIESQGLPNHKFNSTVNPINERCINECGYVSPANVVQCEYLIYDAFEYLHVDDSVQLVFVDLRKINLPIYIDDLEIVKSLNQNKFISKISKKGWWNDECSEYKIGKIESHYCTYIDVNCFHLDYAEDPYSSVIFTFYNTFFNKKIWWIEFPIMRIGGIIH